MAKKSGAKKSAPKKKTATKKKASKKKAAAKKAAPSDDLAPSRKKSGSSKGKISIIRRAYQEGAEKGIGFSRTVWSAIWDGRMLRDFSLKPKQKTRGVVLTDPVPIALHKIVHGWQTGRDNSFAKREYVRCVAVEFDEEGHLVETGIPCPVCTFFGKPSGIALIFAIGDMRRQYDKDNNEIPWAVKRIVLNNFTIRDSILQAVELAAARERREETIAGSVFIINRGQGTKTVRIGDVWVYEKFANIKGATFQKMLEHVPAWDKEYPALDAETLKSMCALHMKVGAEHKLDMSDSWDSDGAQELFGAGSAPKVKGSVTSSDGEDDEDDLMGPPANTEGGPSLSDMDDIEEEPAAEEDAGEEEEVEVLVGTEVTFEDADEGTLQGVVAKINDDVYVVEVQDEGDIWEYEKKIEDLTVVDDAAESEESDEDDDLPFPEEDI